MEHFFSSIGCYLKTSYDNLISVSGFTYTPNVTHSTMQNIPDLLAKFPPCTTEHDRICSYYTACTMYIHNSPEFISK